MKPNQKKNTQKIIMKIQSGVFDENDIRTIFMTLRAYSNQSMIFREVADFVAHNDKRDRGITNNSLNAFYLYFKYYYDFTNQDKSCDIKSPFPPYIKKLINYQIDKCNETILQDFFNITKDELKKEVNKNFIENEDKQIIIRKNSKPSENIFRAISHLLNRVRIVPAFDQNQVVSELIDVIQANKLNVNTDEILKQSDKITVCVILLLHKATFKLSDKQGYCQLSSEEYSLAVDRDGSTALYDNTFGSLNVSGYIIGDANWMEGAGKKALFSYIIMKTNLIVEDWCDSGMFVIRHEEGRIFKQLLFDEHLFLNESGKIEIIDPQEYD